MIWWENVDMSTIDLMNTHITSDDVWSDEVFSFDIETSSAFFINNKWRKFYYTLPIEKYDCPMYSWCYIWMFSINEQVYFGRTLEDFRNFFLKLNEYMGGQRFIVWVHNLSFEMQFLLNVFEKDIYNVFARKKRKPMKFRLYNSEFRCTYFLSRLSLADIGNKINKIYKKKEGDLRYDILRFSDTELSDTELGYCENDCLVLYEYISIKKREYGHLKKIPLTQTGEVRVKVKENMSKNRKWLYDMKKLQPTIQELLLFKDAFTGGLTRANATYTGLILKNVHSYDITSEYPSALVLEKYPVSHFYRYEWDGKGPDENHVAIMIVEFKGLQSISPITYISSSKCYDATNHILDNGRIVSADSCSLCITNVDWDIIKDVYKWDEVIVREYWKAKADYLNSDFVELVLFFFARKNELKDVDGLESLYMSFKQQLNAMYGAMVTNLILPDVVFENGNWLPTVELTKEDVIEKLNKMKRGNCYFSYGQGIFVPAYGRKYITTIIRKCPDVFVYTDTDSIKTLKDISDIINSYNTEIESKIRKQLSVDMSTKCFDKHGTLGTFTDEGSYLEFITFGAKKYISKRKKKIDGEIKEVIETTISGLGKKAGNDIERIEDIKIAPKKGYVFDYKHSYKKMLNYLDNMPKVCIRGRNMNYKYGICIYPTTYTLNIGGDYNDYITSVQELDYEDIDLRQIFKEGEL